jgi:hypothetical protein
LNGGGPIPQRTIVLSNLIAIFVPIVTLAGGIWYASGWVGRIDERLSAIETQASKANTFEGRLGQVEFRLNWMDAEKNRDRDARNQVDRDIRASLDRLNTVVIRLEENAAFRRK